MTLIRKQTKTYKNDEDEIRPIRRWKDEGFVSKTADNYNSNHGHHQRNWKLPFSSNGLVMADDHYYEWI